MSKKDNNPRDDTKIKFEKLLGLMLSWSKENKYKPMQLKEAVAELWMTEQNFFYYINRYPEFKKRYKNIKSARIERIWNMAEENLSEAIWGKKDINDIDLAKLSLDYLKQVDKDYNPKVEVNQAMELKLDISDDELKNRIYELMSK